MRIVEKHISCFQGTMKWKKEKYVSERNAAERETRKNRETWKIRIEPDP